jgi:hypothetical protein
MKDMFPSLITVHTDEAKNNQVKDRRCRQSGKVIQCNTGDVDNQA